MKFSSADCPPDAKSISSSCFLPALEQRRHLKPLRFRLLGFLAAVAFILCSPASKAWPPSAQGLDASSASPQIPDEPLSIDRQRRPPRPNFPETPETPELSSKQKQALLKHNFSKMKDDVDELAQLAKSLQEEVDKSNAGVLSLTVVDKAEKIEKLAHKIKSTAKGL